MPFGAGNKYFTVAPVFLFFYTALFKASGNVSEANMLEMVGEAAVNVEVFRTGVTTNRPIVFEIITSKVLINEWISEKSMVCVSGLLGVCT